MARLASMAFAFFVFGFVSSASAVGCNPGTSECVDGTSYHNCSDYAIWDEAISCPLGQSCVNGACAAKLGCNPGDRECIDPYSYHVCGDHALWNPAQPCLDYQTCSGGRCLPEAQCSSYQQTRCSPSDQNEIQVCNSQYQWENFRSCDYGCSGGYCRACRPGNTRCSDSYHYQTCNSDGQWGSDSGCGNNMVCDGGSCRLSPFVQCSSIGSFRCSPSSSSTLQRCGENYQWADFSFCQMGCFSSACRVCSTGDVKCQDSQTYLKCASNGQWGLATSCPNGYFCFAGSCQVPTGNQCSAAGQKRCSPIDSNMLQACGNSFVYQDYMTCPNGCMNGLCADCKPGTSVCSGANTYRVCASGGQLSDEKACAPGYTCDNGACVATSNCTDGQRNCISDAIYSCIGGEWKLFMLCPSDTDCKESSGTAYCVQEVRQNQSQQPVAPVQPVQPQQPSGNSDLGNLGGIFLATTILLGGAAAYFYTKKK